MNTKTRGIDQAESLKAALDRLSLTGENMTLEEFEVAPKRSLSEAQERVLNQIGCVGTITKRCQYKTIRSLIDSGYLFDAKSAFILTVKGQHYFLHHSSSMPL